MLPTYSGIPTFMRAPIDKNPENKTVIMGVPFDGTTSNRPGACFGPRSIREASLIFDADRDPQYPSGKMITNIVDYGDCYTKRNDAEETFNSIEETADYLLNRGNHLISLGGDHSITLPLLRSHYKKYGQLSLIHFDAHADTWPIKNGRIDHGNFLRQAINEGLIDTENSIQIGLRTVCDKLIKNQIRASEGIDLVYSFNNIWNSNTPKYITFDVDCMDVSVAPGTGTPTSGGYLAREMLNCLRSMGIYNNFIGMDIVETSPPYDTSDMTSIFASTVVQHYLQSKCFDKPEI